MRLAAGGATVAVNWSTKARTSLYNETHISFAKQYELVAGTLQNCDNRRVPDEYMMKSNNSGRRYQTRVRHSVVEQAEKQVPNMGISDQIEYWLSGLLNGRTSQVRQRLQLSNIPYLEAGYSQDSNNRPDTL
jgi:hypothetical protein